VALKPAPAKAEGWRGENIAFSMLAMAEEAATVPI